MASLNLKVYFSDLREIFPDPNFEIPVNRPTKLPFNVLNQITFLPENLFFGGKNPKNSL
jgi:hypothetical protein